MRRLSHVALVGFILLSGMPPLAALQGLVNVTLFIVMMGALFFLFGLVAPNFNALAMEPQGDNAGMASSVVGFVSTAAGALGGGIIGHMFNGSVVPLAAGFACQLGRFRHRRMDRRPARGVSAGRVTSGPKWN